jgi:hypothetical protein
MQNKAMFYVAYIITLSVIIVFLVSSSSSLGCELGMLLIAVGVLLYLICSCVGQAGRKRFVQEDFSNGAPQTDVVARTPIFKEDLNDVRNIAPSKLIFYTTLFHPDSVRYLGGSGSVPTWKSVSKASDSSFFKFDSQPVYDGSMKTLKLEGANSMIGPPMDDIAITDATKFSVGFLINSFSLSSWLGSDASSSPTHTNAVIFQMFGATYDDSDVNLLKISFTTGNSPPTVVQTDSGVQYTGVKMRINYSNEELVSNEFAVASDVVYLYLFLVSNDPTPTVTVKRAAVGSQQFSVLATFATPSNVRRIVHLLNKPFQVCPDGLLDLYIYNVSIFDTVLTDGQQAGLLRHLSNNIVPVDTRCPYNDATCFSDECITIDDWSIPSSLINAPECRKRIESFCKNNVSHAQCHCWDPDDGNYDKLKCRLWRAYIGGDPSTLFDVDTLTPSQISEIRAKFKLSTEEEKKQAIDQAKNDLEKQCKDKAEADAIERQQIRNYYENAPEAGENPRDLEGGAENYWSHQGNEPLKIKETNKNLTSDIVDPYGDVNHKVEGSSTKTKSRIQSVKGLHSETDGVEPSQTGIFNWFRTWVSG